MLFSCYNRNHFGPDEISCLSMFLYGMRVPIRDTIRATIIAIKNQRRARNPFDNFLLLYKE